MKDFGLAGVHIFGRCDGCLCIIGCSLSTGAQPLILRDRKALDRYCRTSKHKLQTHRVPLLDVGIQLGLDTRHLISMVFIVCQVNGSSSSKNSCNDDA